MAWADQARADYAAEQPGTTSRGAYLVEIQSLVIQRPFAVEQFAEASQTAASWADAGDFTLRVPDCVLAGYFLHGHVDVKVAAGTGGQVRLTNVTDANDGTAQTGISNTTYAFSDDLSVQVDAGPNSDVNFKVQIQGDATNLMYARNTDTLYYYACFWWASA